VPRTQVLVAGDHFVTDALIRDALDAELGADTLSATTLTLPWPYTPYGRVAEVDEASGDEDSLIAALAGAQVAVTQMAPFTERVLAASDALKLIVCCRGGPVNINVPAATQRGIAVCTTPGRNAVAAAEHTVALLLAALRQIPQRHVSVQAGEWRSDLYALTECGSELAGTTIGLVGYGAIGRRVARILRAFDAEVLVHDPYLPAGAEVASTPLPELLTRSTVVSLHARLSEETRGMIGAAELAAMPRGATLVNTARGGLVDYPAVVDAIGSGQLGAAAFDVYETEPVDPASPLLTAPHTALTPHLAGATVQTAQRAARLAATAVGAYLRGETPAALANPDALAVR
jgi:D-3-phosphoglycerate dehydrogenase